MPTVTSHIAWFADNLLRVYPDVDDSDDERDIVTERRIMTISHHVLFMKNPVYS